MLGNYKRKAIESFLKKEGWKLVQLDFNAFLPCLKESSKVCGMCPGDGTENHTTN